MTNRYIFLNNFFILCNFLPKFKLQLYGIGVQVPNRYFHDFVAQRFHHLLIQMVFLRVHVTVG